MKMNLVFVILFAVWAVAAEAQEEIDIDWSKVKPISELPELKAIRENQTSVYKSDGNRRRPIIGGIAAKKSQFPYQAALLLTVTGSPYLCGGSLISSTRVLTAAHCAKDVSSAFVILGAINIFVLEPTQVRINVPASGIVYHPQYDLSTLHNDLGMIKLPSAVPINHAISPIDLPEGSNDFVDETGVTSGWGDFDYTKQSSSYLRFASLKVIENSDCRNDFPDIIYDNSMCAMSEGNVGTCHGDSGGPFVVKRNGLSLLIGITSFGSESGCGHEHPTAFARVSSFIPWILSNM